VAKYASGLNQEVTIAIASLMRFAPFSTQPEFKVWRDTIGSLKEVQAALQLIDAFKPGLLNTLVAAAYDEIRADQGTPMPEISALIARYAKRREPLR
jgi:hypothetical protein